MQTLSEFAETTNLRLMVAAGLQPTIPDNASCEFEVPCPECLQPASVNGDRVVCHTEACTFKASRIVDLIAESLRGYKKVKARLERALPYLKKTSSWDGVEDFIRRQHVRRWMRSIAVDGAGVVTTSTETLYGAMRKKGFRLVEDCGFFVPMTDALLEAMQRQGLKTPSYPCLASSLWEPSGEFVGWKFYSEGEECLLFSCVPFATAWFPSSKGCLTFSEAVLRAEVNTKESRRITPPAYVFDNGTFTDTVLQLTTPAPESYVELGTLVRAAKNLHIAGKPAKEWLLERVANHCNGQLSMDARRLMEACPFDKSLQIRAESELIKLGAVIAAQDVRIRTLNHEIKKYGGKSLRVTSDGYELEGKNSIYTTLTNFSLQFNLNLVFENFADVWHYATMDIGRYQVPVKIRSSELVAPAKLEAALRSQTPAGCNLPSIMEMGKTFTYLTPCWKLLVAAMTYTIGVNEIGWAQDRKSFQGAGWSVSMDKVASSPSVFRPDIAALRCFDIAPAESSSELVVELPAPAKDLTAMVVALICRTFTRATTRGVVVQNSHPARTLCANIFKAIGQVTTYDIGNNSRSYNQIPGLSGHPLLVVGATQHLAEQCYIPCVFITEQGYNVVPGDYSNVTMTVRWILQRVVSWLLTTEGQHFAECKAFHYQSALVREGAAVIAAACKMEPWETMPSQLPCLEKIVAGKTHITIGEVIRLVGNDAIIKSDNPGDLAAELLAAGLSTSRDGSEVKVDNLQFAPLLDNYYGHPPQFFREE